jgi:DNA repair exonuclease SbcCD nuclease subunit
VRFLHTADWQWGMPARFLKNADSRARYADARLAAVRGIGEVARREDCEFVLVCGDVYDANQLSRGTVLRTLDALGSIDVPVYLLPGNHDPYEPGSIYRTPELGELPERVRVLGEPGIHRVSEHVELVAAPWLTKRPVEDLVGAQLRGLTPAQDGLVRIVAGHGAVDTFSPDRDLPYLIRIDELRAAVADRRVQYVALGDRHSSTDVGVEGRVWYSGTPEVTDYNEERPGYVLVVDVDDQHCSVTEHQVGAWTFSDVEAELSGASDVAELDAKLRSMPAKETTAVRLALRGTLGLTDYTRLEELMERYAHVFAHLATWDRHTDLAILPAAGESGDLGLSGYAAAAFAELERAAAQGGNEAEDAQGALLLFHRLAGGNR